MVNEDEVKRGHQSPNLTWIKNQLNENFHTIQLIENYYTIQFENNFLRIQSKKFFIKKQLHKMKTSNILTSHFLKSSF